MAQIGSHLKRRKKITWQNNTENSNQQDSKQYEPTPADNQKNQNCAPKIIKPKIWE